MYRCQHFVVQELVGPQTYADLGEEMCWRLLDEPMLRTLDTFREQFGPITINNWSSGGPYKESGLRDLLTPTGAKYSQHKFGRAFDCKFKDLSPAAASAFILANPTKFPLLTTLEDVRFTPTWLHADSRNHSGSGILVVKP